MRMACSRLFVLCVFSATVGLPWAIAVEAAASAGSSLAGALIVARVHEDLRAANHARDRQGAELHAWQLERERLATAINALQAEVARGEQALAAAEAERAVVRAAQTQRVAGEIPLAQAVLAEAARTTRARLAELAASAPLGLVKVPTDDDFDAVLQALEASEKSLGDVQVEISAGHLEGTPADARTAVRLLRVAGLAWWTSLDGANGGTVAVVSGRVELYVAAQSTEKESIRQAIAMIEGRLPAGLVSLPVRPLAQAIASSTAVVPMSKPPVTSVPPATSVPPVGAMP